MSSDHELNIDPESPALQYRIVEDELGHWRLERANPSVPRTPDENMVVAEVRAIFPTDQHDRLYVPVVACQELDAEPGDVVSLITVASVHVSVFVDRMSSALQPLVESIADLATEFASAIGEAFSDLNAPVEDGHGDSGDPREERLPDSIREARARRREQKRSEERELGDNRYGNDG